jgi:metal-dependent amidase/aminoacylase/carboxypeptidase family protein
MPESSVDPIVMAAAVVLRLQTIVSREIAAARSRGGPVTELAERRGAIQAQIDRAMEQVMAGGATPG